MVGTYRGRDQERDDMQYQLFSEADFQRPLDQRPESSHRCASPFKTQLLKWIGNKQKFAHEIISYFPQNYGRYFEPFLGAGGVMASLVPKDALGSDGFEPLVQIWQALASDPEKLKSWYSDRWHEFHSGDRVEKYEKIKQRYNENSNGADLLFLCRSCYGGVVRFRKRDGYMSTPVGVHRPISPDSFAHRVNLWRERVAGVEFERLDYVEAMQRAQSGDLIYCDPPYSFSQAILYGAQDFRLAQLIEVISDCKQRGVYVALSIDGTKKSGDTYCNITFPKHLFEREILVNLGRSMLRRFQMGGKSLEGEVVRDRLLLTF